jgi:hypothetical protein
MNINRSILLPYLLLAIFILTLQFNASAQTYDFESDTPGNTPANVSIANGTIITDSGRTQTMNPASTGNISIINMDLFPVTADYSVTWKETYTTAGRSGFTLRAFGSNSQSTGKMQGYLFQANPSFGNARIYTSNASGYTQLSSTNLAAPGNNMARWYRATIIGSTLSFEYSDNGTTFTLIKTLTNTAYANAGTTQYSRGFGQSISGSFIDNVTYTSTATTILYDFEADTEGNTPVNLTAVAGTVTTNSESSLTQTIQALTAATGTTSAFNMDLFPTSTDYSVTWKETYTTAGRSGFTLRATGANTIGIGLQQGYLFQASPSQGHARIYSSNAESYTILSDIVLTASGINTPRWYRASVEGSTLTFEYSTDGTTFSLIDSITDTSFTSGGATQYTRGYGQSITGSFIDDVSSTEIISPATDIYDFEADTAGNIPANITVTNGTITTNTDVSRTQTMSVLTVTSGNTASFNMDLFATSTDYSVTWKETYTTAGRSGFTLRATGANTTGIGRQQGYLFQASPSQGHARIYSSNAANYTILSDIVLTASGVNTARWYRASVEGSTLTFEYSTDGTTFSLIDSITDTSFTSGGATQYARGYGQSIPGSFIDDVSYTEITSSVDGLTATNINEYQVFQRNGSDQADILISGSYTGSPSAIEASFNGGDYVSIDASPSGGSFSGTLTNQNAGQGVISVRFTNDPAVTSTINNVGIGDIFIIAGQSNASGRGNTLNAYAHGTLKASLFGNDDIWKELTDATDNNSGQIDGVSSDGIAKGSPWPIVATSILAKTGVPVAFVPTAKGGTNINAWQPAIDHSNASTLYGSMYRRITAVGGSVAGVLFFQGESDARLGTTQASYETGLATIVDAIMTDFPGTKTMIGQIGQSIYGGNDAIRAGQIATVNANANALLGPATYDINLSNEGGDTLHFKSDADMAEFATRWYAAINNLFLEASDGYGPILDTESLRYDVTNNKIIVPFTDASSPAISGTSSVTSSSFNLNNNGSAIAISSITINGDTVEITPAIALNSSQTITLTYGSLNTAVDAAIYDSNNLPAQPFYNETVVPIIIYVYDNGWTPSDPNNAATIVNPLIVMNGEATISSSTTCESITVNPTASLIIDSGVTLTVDNRLTLESSSTSYSSLILNGSITGAISYHRHVNIAASSNTVTGNNDLLSPPLIGQNFGQLRAANTNILSGTIGSTPAFLFGPFSTTTSAYVNYTASNDSDLLVTGVGYRSGSTNNGTYEFTGTVVTGEVLVPVSSGAGSKWNLIGNPYPSYLKAGAFINDNTSLPEDPETYSVTIYGYDGSAADGWVIYNLATTTSSTTIAPGQGFFVNAETTDSNISFTTDMQTTATGTSEDDDFIAGRNSEVLTYMKLGLSNGSKNYRTDIYINDNASLGLDLGYDATIWNNTIPNFALYSNLVEEHTGKAMAIQTINNANMSNVTIPLGIKTSGSQSLTFSILESTLPQTSQVYLEDTETNIVTLLNVGNYNINTTNSYSGSGRFFLRIVDSALSIIVEELERINLYTNQTNKQILIKGQLTQNTTLKLYDMQGRLVKTVALQTARNIQSVDASLLSGGIYVVHLSNNQVELTKKIILK